MENTVYFIYAIGTLLVIIIGLQVVAEIITNKNLKKWQDLNQKDVEKERTDITNGEFHEVE